MNDDRESRDWAAYLEEVDEPVIVTPIGGKALCTEFWGRAWNLWLPTLTAYAGRMPKGRTLLRKGKVVGLHVARGEASARVLDGALWTTRLLVKELSKEIAANFLNLASRHTGSVLELLSGAAGDALMGLATDPDTGLFPDRSELKIVCDCLDDADVCAHGAALLYAVGVWWDSRPSDFFLWRGVDVSSMDAGRLAERLGDLEETSDVPRTAEAWERILGVPLDSAAFDDWLSESH